MRAQFIGLVAMLAVSGAQAQNHEEIWSFPAIHHARVGAVIDQAVDPANPPAGFKGLIVGYLDKYGPVYKPYGVATVDGTVPLDAHTLFGIGSVTKLFTATLLAVGSESGLSLDTPVRTLLPGQFSIGRSENRYPIRLVDLADHHAGLPKNAGRLFSSLNDLYGDYAADPIACDPSTQELIHDCGCCSSDYMGLLGLAPTCGAGVASPVYSCPTHAPTHGAQGWVYSNEAFEVLGSVVATRLGFPNWNQANLEVIARPLNLVDTLPLESFGPSQVARAANHCNPATRTTNVNCQLVDWLPVGNAGGGLFSTAEDMLRFLAYNAYGPLADPGSFGTLEFALPIIHHLYEQSPTGGQELGWQTETLSTGELARWKAGDNGPFNAWVGYVEWPRTRMIVLLDNSTAYGSDALGKIGERVLAGLP